MEVTITASQRRTIQLNLVLIKLRRVVHLLNKGLLGHPMKGLPTKTVVFGSNAPTGPLSAVDLMVSKIRGVSITIIERSGEYVIGNALHGIQCILQRLVLRA